MDIAAMTQSDGDVQVADVRKDANAKQKRQFYTRSRTGCTNCRQRRMRCDEGLPVCNNCITRNKTDCQRPVKIPLRDRRAQQKPGEHIPWAVFDSNAVEQQDVIKQSRARPPKGGTLITTSWQNVPWQSVDPFNSLAINMPLKSKALLHYFYQAGQCLDGFPMPWNPQEDCIACATSEPDSLRNILLVAGAHYSWNKGELSDYESTVIYHKVQCIQLVNTWLVGQPQPDTAVKCIKHITTLCFIECCLGNFVAAQMHIDGLMRYMDSQPPNADTSEFRLNSREQELTDRYLTLAVNMFHGLKSRFDDFCTSFTQPGFWNKYMNKDDVGKHMYEWYWNEDGGPERRLTAMRMIPFFFSATTLRRQPHASNIFPIIQSLRNIADHYDRRYRSIAPDGIGQTPYNLWEDGGPSQLFLTVVQCHIDSFSPRTPPPAGDQRSLVAGWNGTSVATGMFLTSVLRIWNQGIPAEDRILCHILDILRRDLESSIQELTHGSQRARDYWFWKMLIGLLSIEHRNVLYKHIDMRLHHMRYRFAELLWTWVDVTGVERWETAKHSLMNIVWPMNFPHEFLARMMWDRTLKEPRSRSVSQTP